MAFWRCTDDVDDEIGELKATMEKQGHGLTMTEALKYEKYDKGSLKKWFFH